MANDLNRCEFIGNVGKIETRFTPSGSAVTNISLACNETWKDKSGQKQEKCTWVPVTIFGALAEIAEKWVNKGDKLYIAGKFSVDKYQDKNTGQDKYSTKVVVDGFNGAMQMLGSKDGGGGTAPMGGGRPQQQPQQSQQQSQPQDQGFDNDFDNDIPFS